MNGYIPGYAYPNPVYQPSMRIIAAISNSNPAIVTTTINHQYLTGIIARLIIPIGLGMQQANQLFGTITVTGDTTFTIPIDTTNFDLFTTNINYPPVLQTAQVVPIGEDPDILYAAVQNVLPYRAT